MIALSDHVVSRALFSKMSLGIFLSNLCFNEFCKIYEFEVWKTHRKLNEIQTYKIRLIIDCIQTYWTFYVLRLCGKVAVAF